MLSNSYRVLHHLIDKEGVLVILDDSQTAPVPRTKGSSQSTKNDQRVLAVNHNYVLE